MCAASAGLFRPDAVCCAPREPEPQPRLQPELGVSAEAPLADDLDAPDEDRIRARIADVIKSRVRRPNVVARGRTAPQGCPAGHGADRRGERGRDQPGPACRTRR